MTEQGLSRQTGSFSYEQHNGICGTSYLASETIKFVFGKVCDGFINQVREFPGTLPDLQAFKAK